MTQTDFSVLVVLICAAFAIRFLYRPPHVFSMHNIFFFAWLYYALSVPIDVVLGLELRIPFGVPDLNAAQMHPYLVQIFLYYLSCGLFFYVAYRIVLPGRAKLGNDKNYDVWLPPLWLILLVNVLALSVYVGLVWRVTRLERIVLFNTRVPYKLFSVSVTFVKAFDLLYMIVCKDRKASIYLLAALVIFSFLEAGRTGSVIFAMLFVARWRISLSKVKLLLFLVLALAFVIYWRPLCMYAQDRYAGGDRRFWEIRTPPISLSGIDATSSWIIFADHLSVGNSPYWLGSSYVKIPLLLTWPRFLSKNPVMTLAEQYMFTFRPKRAARGSRMGFSALCESWLNFGLLGPALLGMVWGTLSKFFDSRPRGITFYIFAFITYRLFRSGAAELYKSYIVVFGGCTLIAYVVLSLLAPPRAHGTWPSLALRGSAPSHRPRSVRD